ncbi:MAG: holo-ACP synthase [Deltaproteobacteria bacterium]|nr:holo-ACP synthase [Deltaproteobacteria bacterium]
MIIGIGVDVVHIPRMDSITKRWGERFVRRVFTEEEIEYCRSQRNPSPHLSVRFAAKEAFLKALGLGYSQGIRWKDIEVTRHPSGRPVIRLRNHAKALCKRYGITRTHVSMSHDGTCGLAQVVLEKESS